MNNHRLLAGVLCAILTSAGSDYAQTVVTLEQLFAFTEQNSVQLRPAFMASDEAQREIEVARSGRLPDIDVNLQLSFIGDGFTTRRDYSEYQKAPIPHFGQGLGITVTQPVYTGGAITNGIRMAELKSTAARYETELQRQDIRFRLTGFYLDLYKCHNLRRVLVENIAQARKVLADMEARHRQGIVIQNDITRYELLVSNLELQQIKLDNTIGILNHNLVETAGLPAETVVVPDSTILSRSLPREGEQWWQTEATSNSPTLKLAQSGVDICQRAEQLTRADYLPKVGLKAAWTLDGPILVEVPPINRNLSYWYVGVGVSYNLGSLYKTNKTMAKQRAATATALARKDAAAQGLEMAVRADYVHYLEAYEELKTQQKSVELAERNYRTTSRRYSAEMALITDMLDAANSKLDAEQQLVNARINIIYYYYKLLFTSGKI